jgi:S-DNA-T family DNA segregation ATPase FtsK/SpoIIIE
VIDAVAAAADGLALPSPRRPWHEPLPGMVTLDELAPRGTVRTPAIGLFDSPATQQQGALEVDLERGGGCVVFGSSGSGKSTALRSMALALTQVSGEREAVAILALDAPSRGLAMLNSLPTVVDVVAADDLEAITRHLDALDRELGRRRAAMSGRRQETCPSTTRCAHRCRGSSC